MSELHRIESERDPLLSEMKAGRAIGSMFFSGFGTAWLILWCLAYGATWNTLMAILLVGTCLAVIGLLRFTHHRIGHRTVEDAPGKRRRSRAFTIINVAQWLVIFVGATVLARLGENVWILSLVIFTVGAHFIPLSVVFRSRELGVIGIALMLAAVIYPHLTAAGPASPLGPLCAGLILWAGAIAALLDTGKGVKAAKIP